MAIISKQIARLLTSRGDPVYVLDMDALQHNVTRLNLAMKRYYRNFHIAYSYKTNYLPLIAMFVSTFGYSEVTSSYEYAYAKTITRAPIIYNGVTSEPYVKEKAAAGGAIVNVDNLEELKSIEKIAAEREDHIQIGVRVNFPIGNGMHSRFGIDIYGADFEEAMDLISNSQWLTFGGFHCHIGMSRPVKFWKEKAEMMIKLAMEHGAKYIDLGGGLYGPMPEDLASQFDDYAGSFEDYAEVISKPMKEAFPDESVELILEPGTALVGNVMDVYARVENIKWIRDQAFITLNINSNHCGIIADVKDLPYKIYWFEEPEGKKRAMMSDGIVAGNTCLEYDHILRHFKGVVGVGDWILIRNVGAYSISTSRQFIVPRLGVVLTDGTMIRRPESAEDMFRGIGFS